MKSSTQHYEILLVYVCTEYTYARSVSKYLYSQLDYVAPTSHQDKNAK